MKYILTIFVFATYLSPLFGQGTQFNNAYGNSGLDNGRNILEASNGLFYIIGSSSSQNGNTDILVFCIDQDGDMVWSNYYGTSQTDIGVDIVQMGDGNLMMLGHTNGIGNGGYDFYIAKISLTGELFWTKTIGGNDWEFAHDMLQKSTGEYLLVGETYSYGEGNNDGFVVVVDEEGETISENTYGTPGNELFASLDVANDGTLVFIGDQKNSNETYSNAWMVRTDSDGTVLWEYVRDFVDGVNELGSAVVFNGEQIVGVSNFPDKIDPPYTSYWSFNTQNEFMWERVSDGVLMKGLLKRNANEFAMMGQSQVDHAYWDYLHFNHGYPIDEVIIVSEYDFDFQHDSFFNAINTDDGGIIIVGETEINSEGSLSVLVTKFDSLLVTPSEISLANLPVGLEIETSVISELNIHPNPARDKVYIIGDISRQSISYNIRDLSGRIISTDQLLGQLIDINMLTDGMYVIDFFDKNNSYGSRKLTVVK